jgi:hypothetical protein
MKYIGTYNSVEILLTCDCNENSKLKKENNHSLVVYVFIIGQLYITTVQYHCNYYTLPQTKKTSISGGYMKGLFKNKANWYIIM